MTIESEPSESQLHQIDVKQASTTVNKKRGKRRVISTHSMIDMDHKKNLEDPESNYRDEAEENLVKKHRPSNTLNL